MIAMPTRDGPGRAFFFLPTAAAPAEDGAKPSSVAARGKANDPNRDGRSYALFLVHLLREGLLADRPSAQGVALAATRRLIDT